MIKLSASSTIEVQPPSNAFCRSSSTDSPLASAIKASRAVRSGKSLSLICSFTPRMIFLRSSGGKASIFACSLAVASSRFRTPLAIASSESPGTTSASSPALTAAIIFSESFPSLDIPITSSRAGAEAAPLESPVASIAILAVIGILLGS